MYKNATGKTTSTTDETIACFVSVNSLRKSVEHLSCSQYDGYLGELRGLQAKAADKNPSLRAENLGANEGNRQQQQSARAPSQPKPQAALPHMVGNELRDDERSDCTCNREKSLFAHVGEDAVALANGFDGRGGKHHDKAYEHKQKRSDH